MVSTSTLKKYLAFKDKFVPLVAVMAAMSFLDKAFCANLFLGSANNLASQLDKWDTVIALDVSFAPNDKPLTNSDMLVESEYVHFSLRIS